MGLSKICKKFLMNKISIGALDKNDNIDCSSSIRNLSEVILDDIREATIEEIIDFIKKNKNSEITQENIPQFSSYENGTSMLIEKLRMGGNFGPTFRELGEQLTGGIKKKEAFVKYGENHAKLGQLYDLVYIYPMKSRRVYLSSLGRLVENLQLEEQNEILHRLLFRIPVIQL